MIAIEATKLGHRATRPFLYWFAAGHFANDFGPAGLWILAPAIAASMNLSPAEIGLLITILQAGAAMAYLPAGLLGDHVSNNGRLLLFTFVWVAIGYSVSSLAPNFWTVVLLLTLAGLGDAAWHPLATGVLVRLRPDRRAEALGIHAVGGSLAEVFSPLAMGFLIGIVGWRDSMLIAALPAAVMALAFVWVSQRLPRMDQRRFSHTDFKAVVLHWCKPTGLKLVAIISSYNMALMAILAMIPVYFQQRHGFSIWQTGVAFSSMILLGALVQPFLGRLSDRLGRRRVILFGNAFAAALAVSAGVLGVNLVITIASLSIATMTLTGIRSVLLAAAVDYSADREGTALGLAFSLLFGIGALGAWFGGLSANVMLEGGFLAAAGFSLIATVVCALTKFETNSVPESIREPDKPRN